MSRNPRTVTAQISGMGIVIPNMFDLGNKAKQLPHTAVNVNPYAEPDEYLHR